MPYRLILTRGQEQKELKFDKQEMAFDEAIPFLMQGYVARMTDADGVVKYTQAVTGGKIATYNGDVTTSQPAHATPEPQANPPAAQPPQSNAAPTQKPWWRFW